MKLQTGFFLTVCTRLFPQFQIIIDPEVYNEQGEIWSGLTFSLVEYLGMDGNSIAGLGEELDTIVKCQERNGFKLQDGNVKVHIFYIKEGDKEMLANVLSLANQTIKETTAIFTAGDGE